MALWKTLGARYLASHRLYADLQEPLAEEKDKPSRYVDFVVTRHDTEEFEKRRDKVDERIIPELRRYDILIRRIV